MIPVALPQVFVFTAVVAVTLQTSAKERTHLDRKLYENTASYYYDDGAVVTFDDRIFEDDDDVKESNYELTQEWEKPAAWFSHGDRGKCQPIATLPGPKIEEWVCKARGTTTHNKSYYKEDSCYWRCGN